MIRINSVMIGGSAAAVHLKHRFSFDADHILSDLKEHYEEVLDFLEPRDDWETARIPPPKICEKICVELGDRL